MTVRSAEGIVSLLAVPIVVDGAVRAVIYGGHRRSTRFGDTVLKGALSVARDLAWEYSAHDEVELRLAALASEGGLPGQRITDPVERQDRRTLFTELREIGREIDDPSLARRLERASKGPGPRQATVAPDAPTPSPRELDVLAQIALDRHNATVVRQLGLTENTVKGYLSSAMRKLEAGSRYEAVVAARRSGLLPRSAESGSEPVTLDDKVTPDLAQPLDDPVDGLRGDPGGDDIPRTDRLQLPAADADDLPPCRAQQPILLPIGLFASPDVLETVPAGGVVFYGHPQLVDDDIRPHLVVCEERSGHPHGVPPEIDIESLGESMPQVSLGRRGWLRRERADEGLAHHAGRRHES